MDINEWNSDTIEQRKQEKFSFLLTFLYTNDNLRGGRGGIGRSHIIVSREFCILREKKSFRRIFRNAKILGERKFLRTKIQKRNC